MSGRVVVIALALAVVSAAALATALGSSAGETAVVVTVGLAGAVMAEAAGAALLRALDRHSVKAQAVVVALTSSGAVVAGVTAVAALMFLSTHDFGVMLVVLVLAGTVGVLADLMLADRVVRSSRALSDLAQHMSDDEAAAEGAPLPVGELEDLRHELAATSVRLRASRKREQALDASRRELVSWVSHDLRTPLAGIRALVEALEDGVVSDKETVTRYLGTIRTEADRLAALVDDLFELSRIQAGSLPLSIQRVSLADLVSDAVAGVATAAEVKGVRLEGSITGVAPEVDLSIPEVMRVLRNLLDNAIRHTPIDGRISVEAGVEGDQAVVSVSDGCGGIPEPDLARVFEVAYQGDQSRSPGRGGAGLGLAIARGLLDVHAGSIDVRNDGPGCRFTIRLPLTR